MPYITQIQREELKTRNPETNGELNYVYSMVFNEFVKENGLSYDTIFKIKEAIDFFNKGKYENNDLALKLSQATNINELFVNGNLKLRVTLDLAFMEFYRRVVIPYENAKLAENGDIYE